MYSSSAQDRLSCAQPPCWMHLIYYATRLEWSSKTSAILYVVYSTRLYSTRTDFINKASSECKKRQGKLLGMIMKLIKFSTKRATNLYSKRNRDPVKTQILFLKSPKEKWNFLSPQEPFKSQTCVLVMAAAPFSKLERIFFVIPPRNRNTHIARTGFPVWTRLTGFRPLSPTYRYII